MYWIGCHEFSTSGPVMAIECTFEWTSGPLLALSYFAPFSPHHAELTTPPPPSKAKIFLSENRKALKTAKK